MDYFTKQQQNTYSSEAYMEHSPRYTTFWVMKHLNKFKRLGIIQCLLSDHRIKIKINNGKTAENTKNK